MKSMISLKKTEEKKSKTDTNTINIKKIKINDKLISSQSSSNIRYPKNMNQFRHLFEDVKVKKENIDFMLELRRHKKINNIEKNVSGLGPSFYDEDLQKYKQKISKTKDDQKDLLSTNFSIFRYLFHDRSKLAIRKDIYKFEVSLRDSNNFYASKSVGKENEKDLKLKSINSMKTINLSRNKNCWDSTGVPKGKNLFNILLPPLLNRSKEIYSKVQKGVGRPIVIVNKEGIVNGEKIKCRIFDYNGNLALRYPCDHLPNSRYTNDYGIQNLGEIKHYLDFDQRTMNSYFVSNLRGNKKTKMMPEETKQREIRLKKITIGKTISKN